MYDDIKAAIDKNLSSEVSNRLRSRLETLEKLEIEVEQLKATLASRLTEIGSLKSQLSSQQDLEDKEKSILIGIDKLSKLEMREEILKIREACADSRIKDNLQVVMAVFANNRFKYSDTGSTSSYANNQSTNGSTSRTCETLG